MTPEEAAAQEREIQARVNARLSVAQPPQGQPAGWGQPQQPMTPAGQMGGMAPQAVLVPVNLTGPDGREVTIQLSFSGEHAANPQALMALIGSLMQQGIPVRAFAPKQGGNWGGGGGGGGGGYQSNGGGYQNNYRGGGGNGGYQRRW